MGRATVNKAVQVGVETTPGTAVPAGKALPSLSFVIGPKFDHKNYRAQGYKFNTTSQIHKIWGEGSYDGPLSFNEVIYPLSTLFGAPTPSTPVGATLAREWLFKPAAKGPDAIKTLTIEQGDASAATIMSNCAAVDFNLSFMQDDVTVKGNIIGRTPVTGVLTATPTEVAHNVVSARYMDVYVGTVLGALGVTLFGGGNKITDAISETFNVGKKLNARWVHNTSYQSFKDFVELAPELTLSWKTEHNAQSRAQFDAMPSNGLVYVGIRATGPIIEGAITNMFEVVCAARVMGAVESDEDGVWAYEYQASPENDATLGSAFWIRVVNSMTAL